jgi:uncharacterized membrane protein YfcA
MQVWLAGLIIFAAHLVSAVTGFGSNVLGLPLLALVVGLAAGKAALVVLSTLMYLYLSLRWRHQVDWRQLGVILLIAGLGLPLGMWLFGALPRRASNLLLGAFVIGVGVRGLLQLAPRFATPRWLARAMLFAGGVVHGAFTTGGPLLVVYCRRAMPDKSTFRATLSVVWLLLNVALMVGWTATRAWSHETLRVTLVGLPFLVAGTIAGESLHHRVDERAFTAAVNLTLIAVGAVLLFAK